MSQVSQRAELAVIGAGAWGTMLAVLLAENGHTVKLWTRRADHSQELDKLRENRRYLPGLSLPSNIQVSSELSVCSKDVEAALLAVPSRALREVLAALPAVPACISCAKGLELGSFKRLSEVISEYQQSAKVAALSGPNLAKEIQQGLPAAATLASADESFAKTAQRWLNSDSFRVYRSSDLIGVEVAGAMKNVIALAAGMCDGLKLGDNAKASIITRGLAEIVRLGVQLGGQPQTFYGLAGLGDLVATCSSATSRNHTAGERIARGETLAELEAARLTAEGIPTTQAVFEYARREGLELPISSEVYGVIFEQKPPRQALDDLMKRELKAEW